MNRKFIYKIYNPKSNRTYIGVSNNPEHRWCQHRSDENSAIYPAIKKWGWDSLEAEVIFGSDDGDYIYEMEKYFIEKYEAYSKGYNRTKGGDRAGTNCKLSEDEVLEIVQLLRENKLTIRQIAPKFNISEASVRAIENGKYYANITGELNGMNRKKLVARGENQGNSLLTEDIVRKMKISYMEGSNISEIVKKFKVKRPTVEAVLQERNWKHVAVEGYYYKKNVKMSNLNKEDVLHIRQQYSEGKKITEISKDTGVSRNTVSNIVKKKTWKNI
jgi:transposase